MIFKFSSYICCFILVLSLNIAKSQSIQVDESVNWQQYISTILGGSCVEISNLQYVSGDLASGYFINGNNPIGLNNGIVISTGNIFGYPSIYPSLNSPPSNFLSSINNLPGDPLLTSLAGSQSFDASILEFDFTSPINDTVKIKYVFASEEYPEWVNSGFNDIFGFFVSGGGFNNHNIALLPDNSTVVSIDNVNAQLNSIYHIATPNNTSFAYDGYTVPLTAKFYAQAGVTYHLKIAIADVGDSVYDSAVFLESFQLSPQNISGQALLNGEPIEDGVVEIFGLNVDSTQANLVATFQLEENGHYNFENLEAGSYILKATPNSTTYPNAIPKYYDNVYTWDAATVLSLPCSYYNFGLTLAPIFNGGSEISGNVSFINTTLKTTEDFEGERMADVNILLYDLNLETFIKFTKTDELGEYFFKDLVQGNYKVIVDIPGLSQTSFHEINLNENEFYTTANYLVGLNKIIKQTTLSYHNLSSSDSKYTVYPIPFSDIFYINSSKSVQVDCALYDISGRKIKSISSVNLEANTPFLFQTDDIKSGIFLLEIKSGLTSQFIKLLK